MPWIDRSEGRRLFGSDPAAYDAARPGHAERVYEVLAERCGLGPGARVLEVGPGTGQATRRLLALGADPIDVVEPDPALASHLRESLPGPIEIHPTSLEDAGLPGEAFDLAVAASSFHWVEEAAGLAVVHDALRPGGWFAMWWTLFGVPGRKDAFMKAVDPLLEGLDRSPTHGVPGRPPFALDVEARAAALDAAGFEHLQHETVRWTATWDTPGIRALYATFSPIATVPEPRRTAILDGIAAVARDFGGVVKRTLVTSLYTARRPA